MNKMKIQKHQDRDKVKWDAKGPLQLTPQDLFIGATDEHALVMVGRMLAIIDALAAKDFKSALKIAARGGEAFATFKKFAKAATHEARDKDNVSAVTWILKEHIKEFFRTSPEGRAAKEKYTNAARARFYQESRPLKDYDPALELPEGHTPEQAEKRRAWERENKKTVDYVVYSHKGNKIVFGPDKEEEQTKDRIEFIFKPVDKTVIADDPLVLGDFKLCDSEGNSIAKVHFSTTSYRIAKKKAESKTE